MIGVQPQASRNQSFGVVLATLFAGLLAVLNIAAIGVGIGLVVGWKLGEPLSEETIRMVLEHELAGLTAGVLGASSALLIVAVALAAEPRERVRERLRLHRAPFFDYVLVAMGMFALATALTQLITLLNLQDAGALGKLASVLGGLTLVERVYMVPVLALAPGIAEEVFFRGYALTRLGIGRDRMHAVVLSSVLFGLIHLDPLHSAAALMMGVFLAYAVTSLGSILPAIVAHVLNNAAAVLFPDFGPSTAGGQAATFAASLAVFAFIVWELKKRTPQPAQW